MALTSPRKVTSGYYRNHLYVLLGFNVLATLVAWSNPSDLPLAPPLAAAVLSYIGSVAWLYEKPRAGIVLLVLVAASALWGAIAGGALAGHQSHAAPPLAVADVITSGALLGVTLAAMFLGHWYLNSPTMSLKPLERLVLLLGGATGARAAVCAAGLSMQLAEPHMLGSSIVLFLVLRWLAGVAAPLLLAWMTWRTLKIPNTQSATGILYVAVIVTFIGELTSLLLASELGYPL